MTTEQLAAFHHKRKAAEPIPPAKLRLTKYEPKEALILASILDALGFCREVAWAERMNSGAYVIGEGIDRRYVRYGFPGCPDILGQMADGRLLAIEAKRPSGILTPAQAAVLDRISSAGGVAGVCRSVDEAVALVRGCHLQPPQSALKSTNG